MIKVYVGGWNSDFSNLIMTHITMPVSEDRLKDELLEIGVDIENGGDYRIQSFRCPFDNISRSLNTTDNIWELNTLAQEVSELDEFERSKLNAACALRKCNGAVEVLNLAADLDRFEYLPADNDEALGEFELETGRWDIPDGLIDYIDCEKLGRETRLKQGGVYYGIGYIYEVRDEVLEQGGSRDFKALSGSDTQDRYGDESEDDEWER